MLGDTTCQPPEFATDPPGASTHLVRYDRSTSRSEGTSCTVSEMLNIDSTRQGVTLEHCRLKRRAPCAERFDNSVGLRLHNKMDMRWAMRPEAHIYLGGFRQAPNHAARAAQQRSHLGRFVHCQISDPHDMARGLDHESSHPQRSDTVLNAPVVGLVDRTTWEIAAPVGKVTGDATAYVHNDARITGAAWYPIS